MKYGVQLYSVRDFCDTDMDYAFSRLQEFKYSFVEFAGFYDNSAEEVKAIMEKYDIGVVAAHVSAKDIVADFEGVVQFHKTIGNDKIVIPCYDHDTKEQVDELVDIINKYQPMFEKEGMKLYYHNHDFDFLPNDEGVVVFDELLTRTNVLFEIDTFWAFFAGKDPIELINSLGDRVELVHIKDGLADKSAKSLGEGFAPVKDCVRLAIEKGFPIIVESEGMIPDGISEVKRCYKFLRKMSEEEGI